MSKKKLYLTLDTETCTLSFADAITKNCTEKQKIAISKPLVYDIGWTITDRQGNIIKTANYLVNEIFFVPSVFKTAYYKNREPVYMQLYREHKIVAKNWNDIVTALLADLQTVSAATAYNAAFDFKKAIPFTEQYISHFYDVDFKDWIEKQKTKCLQMLDSNKTNKEKNPTFLKPFFKLRDVEIPIIDLWGLACNRCLNNTRYKNFCLKNKYLTKSGEFFQTSAEVAFRYLMKNIDFIEDHTALSDALIEAQILTKILKKGSVTAYLQPFPFRMLGTTLDYVQKNPKYVENVFDVYTECAKQRPTARVYNALNRLAALMAFN